MILSFFRTYVLDKNSPLLGLGAVFWSHARCAQSHDERIPHFFRASDSHYHWFLTSVHWDGQCGQPHRRKSLPPFLTSKPTYLGDRLHSPSNGQCSNAVAGL
jgi:hypothetical protein